MDLLDLLSIVIKDIVSNASLRGDFRKKDAKRTAQNLFGVIIVDNSPIELVGEGIQNVFK